MTSLQNGLRRRSRAPIPEPPPPGPARDPRTGPQAPRPPPERARGGSAGAASDGARGSARPPPFLPTTGRSGGPDPATCPSRSRSRHTASDWCEAWPGPFQPRPPRMDRPGGRGVVGRTRPAVSLRGRPGGGRTLAGCLVAGSRALPLAACGEIRALQGPPPPPRPDLLLGPLLAKFLPRAHPRLGSGPAWVRRATAARRAA